MTQPTPIASGARVASASSERVSAQLAAIVEHAADAILALDERGRIVSWNPAAERLYGFSAYEVIGRRPTMIVPPELDCERDEMVRGVVAGRPAARYETERVRKDGSRVAVAITLSPIRDADGHVVGASAITRDISEQRRDERRRDAALHGEHQARIAAERTQRRLAEAQQRFRIAFQHAPNGIALLSTAPGSEGSFLEVNPALGEQLGFDGEDLLGRSLLEFIHADERHGDCETLRALLDGTDDSTYAERLFQRGDGHAVWLQIRASVVRDRSGRPLYTVAHLQDVTDARRHEAELQHLADHDALTGLVNRRGFESRLDAALADGRETGRPAAVLVIDLDNFKGVNDTYGHAVGDELLRRVAAAMRSRVRDSDIVARLGGDEFGVLLSGVSPRHARMVAAELIAAINGEAGAPAGDGLVRVTASVGISPIDPSAPATAEEMLVEADIAMYEAKSTGRNRLAVAAAEGRSERRRAWSGLGGGDDGLELWEQPMLNLSTGECDRAEMLVRMRDRDGETIPAGRFLPLAKRSGQAQAIDSWVVTRAVAVLAQRQAAGLHGGIEVNLAAVSVLDEGVMGLIRSTITRAAIDPRAITFEVTETAAIGDLDRARRHMSRLSDLGCRFALDDFGAGIGSLHHLKHLPFDVVKIDGDFVTALATARFDQLAVRAVVDIARGSGKLTVAERVGDDATIAMLRDLGVDYAQGFHIARPRPVRPPAALQLAA